jgi:uncharacterized protein involved in outer membrane biogenesis
LGSGKLEIILHDGRLSIDSLQLDLPGGSVHMSASVKPGKQRAEASLEAKMHNFDIGILARRSRPETKMTGLVNLDVDLRSSAASVNEILANGTGYFDFSGQLKNLGAGIIDLWAVNLVAAILSRTDKQQSQINCAIGRWSANNGMLAPDVFLIDTSKIRICSTGTVDLNQARMDLRVEPMAKKPEFFNLATPLEIHGSFDDINLQIEKGAMLGTALKFITSPVHVPIRRIVTEAVPEDGSDACKMALGPQNRSDIRIAGCSEARRN